MNEAHHFLVNLALVLCVAAVTTVLFQRLRQPVVLGYLLAGAIVSPHTPFPLFADENTVHALSELGVILLMFSLGLEFSIAKLIRVAPTAGLVAVIQCTLMIWLGYVCGQLFGWTTLESLYAGALIAISSTTIIVKAFAEQNVRGRLTEIVFGVLIVEDLIAIFLLAVLTTISAGGTLTAESLAFTTGRLVAFLAIVLGGGLLIVPWLIRSIVRLERPETTVVTAIGLCFAFALMADAAGYSVALGAFLGGALVAESGEAGVVEHLVQPVRDMFAAVFFVAVGMMIDPASLTEHWAAILVLTIVVVLGKLVGVAIGVFLTGEGIPTAVRAGMSLAQIGEFSFIIAAVGLSTGATRPFLYAIAVAVSALTTLLTPWLIRASYPVVTYLDSHLPAPIQTFAALYGTWVEQIRSRPREPSVGRQIRQLMRWLVVDAALLAAIIIVTAIWGERAAEALRDVAAMPAWLPSVIVVGAAVVLAAPFCIGVVRCAAGIARLLATVALPEFQSSTDLADAPRRVLIVTLEMGILLLIGLPLVAVTQPFLPAYPGALVMVLFAVLLAASLWRNATNLQEHARAGAQAIVEVLARQLRSESTGEADNPDLHELHRVLPGLGAPTPVRVQAGAAAEGRTLAQINLRGLTGATVLAIVRSEDGVLTPTGRETLRAGDLLAVAGTASAVEAAQQLISRPRDSDDELLPRRSPRP